MPMDTLFAIQTRRSIRQYIDKPITNELLEHLTDAGFVAPSALDERPWHFIRITEPEILRGWSTEMGHCEMLETAMAGLVICAEPAIAKLEGFWQQDCAACTENILLAAHALGLGACWIALDPIPDRVTAVRTALNIPATIVPFALISLGYPAEDLPGEDRRDASRLHDNAW